MFFLLVRSFAKVPSSSLFSRSKFSLQKWFFPKKRTMAQVKQPVCLIVIDGWGVLEAKEGLAPDSLACLGNAIANADTPNMDRLCGGNCVPIEAHGLHVGLPEGIMGNSEVGHLNIGAGRVVYQDIVRITKSVDTWDIVKNEAMVKACENAKSKTGRIHFLGLVSDGSVHSHIDHLFALVKVAKELGVARSFIQYFGDGRDTSPHSGVGFIQQVLDFTKNLGYGELATVVGRYYAMDRDKRWERCQVAYEALLVGKGELTTPDNVVNVVKARYEKDETDEFLKPIIVTPDGRIQDNDTVVFIDFRADRMRQIVETMGIQRHIQSDVRHPEGLHIITMTEYKAEFPFPLLFPKQSMKNVLAEWLGSLGLSQFHCAETEKYAHVTFFFNGGREGVFNKEERYMVDSPKHVPTYDFAPAMSCQGVADKMAEVIATKKHPFVMCNFAPPDMVGHTGIYEAAVKACTATDKAIGTVEKACKENGYILMLTADHGNAEKMVDENGGKHTAHTCYPVPFLSTGSIKLKKDINGRPAALCDVAPSVLDQMGLETPPDMTGASVLDK